NNEHYIFPTSHVLCFSPSFLSSLPLLSIHLLNGHLFHFSSVLIFAIPPSYPLSPLTFTAMFIPMSFYLLNTSLHPSSFFVHLFLSSLSSLSLFLFLSL